MLCEQVKALREKKLFISSYSTNIIISTIVFNHSIIDPV